MILLNVVAVNDVEPDRRIVHAQHSQVLRIAKRAFQVCTLVMIEGCKWCTCETRPILFMPAGSSEQMLSFVKDALAERQAAAASKLAKVAMEGTMLDFKVAKCAQSLQCEHFLPLPWSSVLYDNRPCAEGQAFERAATRDSSGKARHDEVSHM